MSPVPWRPQWLHEATCQIAEPRVWRGVETQYISATALLVDTHEEHDLLEDLLEASKPPMSTTAAPRQHYLLTSPFRYTPQAPSRFRAAGHRGLWYGARELRAACAEVAYWRMVFIRDSDGLQGDKLITRHTFFAAMIAGLGIDLTASPWSAAHTVWTDPQDYGGTQALAQAAEAAGIAVIQYASVRAPGDTNFAVFTPAALKPPHGGIAASQQGWTCAATRDHVLMWRDRKPAERFEWTR